MSKTNELPFKDYLMSPLELNGAFLVVGISVWRVFTFHFDL